MKFSRLGELGLRLKQYRYPALILALGLLLLLIPSGNRQKTQAPRPVETAEFDLAEFTARAETLLSRVKGAGEVHLLLSLESDGRRSYQTDGSRSGDSGQREEKTVLITRDGDQAPVPVTRQYPEFRGAVVLSPGAGSPEVVLGLKQALSSLTGLGLDKITVLICNSD